MLSITEKRAMIQRSVMDWSSPAYGRRPCPPNLRTVAVTNLPMSVTEEHVVYLLQPFGEIVGTRSSENTDAHWVSVTFSTFESMRLSLCVNKQFHFGREIGAQPYMALYLPSDQELFERDRHQSRLAPTGPHSFVPQFYGQQLQADVFGNRQVSKLNDEGKAQEKVLSTNIYVLNLPLNATSDSMAELFGHCGLVTHCVILAITDSQARRRGFIDMGAPWQALRAMDTFNGYVWNGYPIEVSHAFVQRNGGPLADHKSEAMKCNLSRNRSSVGSRRALEDNRSMWGSKQSWASWHPEPLQLRGTSPSAHGYLGRDTSALPSPLTPLSSRSSLFSAESGGQDSISTNNSFMMHSNPYLGAAPTYLDAHYNGSSNDLTSLTRDPITILVRGLDPSAIVDNEDFRRAFEPYGSVGTCSLAIDEHQIPRGYGLVSFCEAESARRAFQDINGKVRNGKMLTAEYVAYSSPQPKEKPISVPASAWSPPWMKPGSGHLRFGQSAPNDLQVYDHPSKMPSPSAVNINMSGRGQAPQGIPFPYGPPHFNQPYAPSQSAYRSTSQGMPHWMKEQMCTMGAAMSSSTTEASFGAGPPHNALSHLLGEPFVPTPSSNAHASQDHHAASASQPQASLNPTTRSDILDATAKSPPSELALSRMTLEPWTPSGQSTQTGATSPGSALSYGSTATSASNLQTPENTFSRRNITSNQTWPSQAHDVGAGVWSPTTDDKHLRMSGFDSSALRALQQDSPPHVPSRRRATLDPVGHEHATGSPPHTLPDEKSVLGITNLQQS
ncbi:Polyadenylate-binding protein (RRM superfamily) [Ceraceosorus bombacis]|uniref:Polyadenylate-binding protein (RRM superfamily) n=1 Tax=Ceraceosorus bombacis TaxID=401625 RepID=A0A0P1BKT9_9BASI|nr:Polyadenylate-binding protein (RRM superfamily) [Ceraceosorus bombacis]